LDFLGLPPKELQTNRAGCEFAAACAAGVVYTLGQVNFLAGPASEPCATADQR
jgi:hypothetical protein